MLNLNMYLILLDKYFNYNLSRVKKKSLNIGPKESESKNDPKRSENQAATSGGTRGDEY